MKDDLTRPAQSLSTRLYPEHEHGQIVGVVRRSRTSLCRRVPNPNRPIRINTGWFGVARRTSRGLRTLVRVEETERWVGIV